MIRAWLLLTIALLSARADAAPPAGHTAFALIVTNNRSGALGRPDLQYADDDGARYYALFQTLMPPDHVRLLTDFDRDTSRLFPALAPLVVSPSRANVAAARAQLAAQVAAAVHAGVAVDFYFVFAGHGDVEHGKGFLQLTDGALDADELEALIASIPASHAHVILDSCNSFFVINARKPGGRRFATPADASAGLAGRLPNVGVFVSTSAEAEVFEWSELQSGVFSHAVRSGLAGAADANGDGAVSYDELRAFVDTATAEVKNAAFRPKVFAHGPGGDDRAPLFFPTTTGARLTLDRGRAVRLTVRDRDELPWLDVFKEADAAMTLRIPPALSAISIDERDPTASTVRRFTWPAEPTAQVALAELGGARTAPAPRGADQLFRRLFTRPFGPRALARYEADRAAAPPPVFGVSRDDADRMGRLLAEVDDTQREQRRIAAGAGAAIGLAGIAVAATASGWSGTDRALVGGLGAAVVALSAYRFTRAPASEHLRDDLAHGLASAADPAVVVAAIDRRLHAAAAHARRERHLTGWLGAALVVTSTALHVIDHETDHSLRGNNETFTPMLAGTATVGALSLVLSFTETPLERTTRLWDTEPGLLDPPRFAITPTAHGGAISLVTTF